MANMLQLKWLYPGMRIKRWIFLCAVGMLCIGLGSYTAGLGGGWIAGGILIMCAGVGLMISGMRRMMRSILQVLLPEQSQDQLVEMVYRQRQLERGPKLVAIGGGTGLSTLLMGLKQHTSNITALVTVGDDGGSSGRLRTALRMPPPGDIRNCLVALAGAEPLMRELFQYRFESGEELHGHNFGNLFIAAMMQVTGDFETAVRESSRVLNIRGRVLPSCNQQVSLVAQMADGRELTGETQIGGAGVRVERLRIEPKNCVASSAVLESIKEADGIILGPGSLYTSILPNLLVQGVTDAIQRSLAPKIYVCNVMTQSSETDGYTAADHVDALVRHTAAQLIDYAIVNTAAVPQSLLQRYKEQQAHPVEVDYDRIRALGAEIVDAPVISTTDYVRHDAEQLGKLIISIIDNSRTAAAHTTASGR
jgi:uncharacterized cofD-like protein